MLERRSDFCSSESLGLAGSRAMGLYLAKTSMPKSAVALAIVKSVVVYRVYLQFWIPRGMVVFEEFMLRTSKVWCEALIQRGVTLKWGMQNADIRYACSLSWRGKFGIT